MNKFKKLSALLLTGVLTISLTGCLGGEPELTVNLSNPDPVNTSSSASGNTDNNGKDNTVVTDNNTDNTTVDTDNTDTDVASPVAVQSGEAVLYNGQILFREYHPFQIESEAVWGEFSFDSATYGSKGHLCTFDPSDPGSGVKEIVEDPGFGDMYLVNGEELYSQYYTNSEDYSRNYNMVYKTNLSTSKTEDICEGNITGFSPDGKHLAVYNYVTDPYLTHFNIYDTADLKNPSANYTSDKGMVYLGIDNDNLYFLENDYDNDLYYIKQLGFDGAAYTLAACNFKDVIEGYASFPEYYDAITIDDKSISVRFDFYEGTGHFYFTSVDVTVPKAVNEQPSDKPLFEADMKDSPQDEDPNGNLPSQIASFESYPSNESGRGFARVIQYYNTFDEGTFFAVADCHRDPMEDVGWRSSYFFLNLEYCFVPAGSKEFTVVDKMFDLLGERGNVSQYEYDETMNTMFVYAGFFYDEDNELVGTYYEPVYIDGPESPIEESGYTYIAELADDFYFECFNWDEDMYGDDFTQITDVVDFKNELLSFENPPLKAAEYDYEGYLVFGSDDYSFEKTSGYICHMGWDSDGNVYYVRPVLFD